MYVRQSLIDFFWLCCALRIPNSAIKHIGNRHTCIDIEPCCSTYNSSSADSLPQFPASATSQWLPRAYWTGSRHTPLVKRVSNQSSYQSSYFPQNSPQDQPNWRTFCSLVEHVCLMQVSSRLPLYTPYTSRD